VIALLLGGALVLGDGERQQIYDDTGHRIAEVRKGVGGRFQIYDARGRRIGEIRPAPGNRTELYDAQGRRGLTLPIPKRHR
jgi:hypothetical protein